jgi:cytochrome c oxidase assembly protein subunit 11
LKSRRNGVLAGTLALVIAGMVGASFAAIPLYRVFCQATGYGGTPKIGPAASPGATEQMITVRFDANTYPDLPWHFVPVQHQVRVHLGADQAAFYEARNEAGTAVTGVATYTVTPDKAAKYFHKTACFCFNEQTLAPNQEMQFPLSFWVDPAIASDRDTADVKIVTLSYTFFRSLDDAARSGALAKAGPHVGPVSQQALSRLQGKNP